MARKIRRRHSSLLTFWLCLAISMLLPTAFAMWNIGSFGFTFSGRKTTDRAVAVLESDTNVYYTSIEAALSAASSRISSGQTSTETVYVIPGISSDSDPIFMDSCTISSGVTLCLPYAYDSSKSGSDAFTDGFEGTETKEIYDIGAKFADSTPADVKTNKKTEVVLMDNSTLTVARGGRLVVGGKLGISSAGDNNVLGMTYSSYSELSLGEDSSIISDGTIDVRGYIKPWSEEFDDTCSIIVGQSFAGSSLNMPVVFYDFVGGSVALSGSGSQVSPGSWNGSALNGVFPIEIFDMPNVAVPTRVYGGSAINCWYAMYMKSDKIPIPALQEAYLSGTLGLVGFDNSIMTLSGSSSYIEVDYDPAAYYETSGKSSSPQGGSSTLVRGLSVNDAYHLRSNRSGTITNASYTQSGIARTTITIHGDVKTNDINISFTLPVVGDIPVNTAGGTATAMTVSLNYKPLAVPFSYKWDITIENGTASIPNRIKFLPGSKFRIADTGTMSVSGEFISFSLENDGDVTTKYYPLLDQSGDSLKEALFINEGGIIVTNTGSFAADVTTASEGATMAFDVGSKRSVGAYSVNWKTSDGVYGPRTFDAMAVVGTSGEDATKTELQGVGSAFRSEIGSNGKCFYSVQGANVTIVDNGLTGFSLQIDGNDAEFVSGEPISVSNGAVVRIVVPKTSTSIGSVRFNGSTLPFVDDGENVVASATVIGPSTIEIVEAVQIAISSATVNVTTSAGSAADRQDFSISWEILDQFGTQLYSKEGVAISSGSESVSLSPDFPREVRAGWKFNILVDQSNIGNDTISAPIINGDSSNSYSYTFGVSDNSLNVSLKYTVVEDPSGCLALGTMVTMADGTCRPVEELKVGDRVLSFSHETGSFESQEIMFFKRKSAINASRLTLDFSNGASITVVFAHAFLNFETRLYEEISPENVSSHLGDWYAVSSGEYVSGLEKAQLVGFEVAEGPTEFCNIATAYNLNAVTNGLLSISDDIQGLYNYFDLNDEFAYDEAKKEKDIETYGLFTYDELSSIMSRNIYDLFNVKYLKVSIGKGLVTFEELLGYVDNWGDEFESGLIIK